MPTTTTINIFDLLDTEVPALNSPVLVFDDITGKSQKAFTRRQNVIYFVDAAYMRLDPKRYHRWIYADDLRICAGCRALAGAAAGANGLCAECLESDTDLPAGMTFDAARKYVENPHICPFCGSDDLDATGNQFAEDGKISQRVACLRCDQRWLDVYLLKTVNQYV